MTEKGLVFISVFPYKLQYLFTLPDDHIFQKKLGIIFNVQPIVKKLQKLNSGLYKTLQTAEVYLYC